MSDLAVANLGIENHGVESCWAAPAGLTAPARDALIKAVARVPPAWLLPPGDGELFDKPDEVYARLQGYALGAGFAVETSLYTLWLRLY